MAGGLENSKLRRNTLILDADERKTAALAAFFHIFIIESFIREKKNKTTLKTQVKS